MSVIAIQVRPAEASPALVPGRRARDKRMWLAIACIVTLVVVFHGRNMLHYPYLEADEGTYASQAWAVSNLGRLAPYTYFYDHPPLGWIQIALWQFLTGGHRFGYALASGRVLMLLFQIGSAVLVLVIGRRSSGKLWVGLLAATIFSLSAYGIFHHRRILLDNIGTFWLLLSLYFLTRPTTLRRVWLSGIAIGLAVLSKENAIAALPALAILVARQSPRSSRVLAVTGFLTLSLSVCSIYVLMALLRGELFPAGTVLGGHHPHVSLICSLEWQASRSPDGGLLNASSAFWGAVLSWAHAEPLLVIGGSLTAAVAIAAFRRDPFISMLAWMVLSLWLFLGRGGIVLDFYLIPLLPLLALSLAFFLDATVALVRGALPSRLAGPTVFGVIGLAVAGCASLLTVGSVRSGNGLWTERPVDGQIQAVHWIERHLSPGSRLLIDMSMWLDLHDPPPGEPVFRDAHYYWKVGEDPQVRSRRFGDNWRNVDYVIQTPQLFSVTRARGFPVVAPALEHSVMVATFDTGFPIEVRRVAPGVPAQFRFRRVNEPPMPSCMTYGS